MDKEFKRRYEQLNTAQRQAVDIIDGPVLVVAGPGTGKTELLSLRVANILRHTDIDPSNILCLTYTDNAARNMRERLETVIGQAAYHVSINTFHSFGSEVINQFPDYFASNQLLQPVDELGQYQVFRELFETLPHSNPLSVKVGEDFVHLRDSLQAVGWLKQNALGPDDLHAIINANKAFIEATSDKLAETFSQTPSPKLLDEYQQLAEHFREHEASRQYGFPAYGAECASELEAAIEATSPDSRFAPKITAWRNKWCQKDAAGRQVFKDAGQALRKMHALANLYYAFQQRMAEQGLFDFDDMIVEVVGALESHDDLRYSLQERYQYVLVDEFQDTNKAQLRMLYALGDNPVYENRPNIMTVGDDDQAIYAFQGAEVSNMVDFARRYRDPALITLSDNYRSTPGILEASFAVAEQISDRLESLLAGAHKQLTARADHKSPFLTRPLFPSELAQYDWVAEQIEKLVKAGTKPEDIAVIAPRHKYLERLMPYLGDRRLPVAYERRENILEAPIIVQLITMARLVTAIAESRHHEVDQLISQVLSYEFWDIQPATLLAVNLECYDKKRHWLDVLSKHKSDQLRSINEWLMELAANSRLEPMEYILDKLLGNIDDGVDSEYDDLLLPKRPAGRFVSPMRAYYFNSERYELATDAYLTLLGQLSTLRYRLRHWKPNRTLYIKDFVEFADLHLQANLKIVDTNPHTQTTNAVQVMTAYKAKGLEFDSVFVINAQDEVWGPTARQRSPTISLPKNLPLAPASDGDNDKLRLLFVALTRAKRRLYVTGYSHNHDNKPSPALSFIGGSEGESVHPAFKPKPIDKPATAAAVQILATDWAYRYRQVIADKPDLFEPILASYKLSVTHLNNFIDIREAGPGYFLLHNLLRFPEAISSSAAYGDAVHKTLQWAHTELRKNGKLPAQPKLEDCFAGILAQKHLKATEHAKLERRGYESLERYFAERAGSLSPQDVVERGFNNEGVVVAGAYLSGKIDKLCFPSAGEVRVVDFKTGKPATGWQGKDEHEKVKLHKYRQQLMFYKLLVEHSASYGRRYKVSGGALEFIEPDRDGHLVDNLELAYDEEELNRFVRLIGAVWAHITSLQFPDVTGYPPNLKGILQFEQDLIDGKV